MIGAGRASSVDFSHLENYVAGDKAVVREVLALFSDQARTVLPTLDPAALGDAWRHAAHSLKGSALGARHRRLRSGGSLHRRRKRPRRLAGGQTRHPGLRGQRAG